MSKNRLFFVSFIAAACLLSVYACTDKTAVTRNFEWKDFGEARQLEAEFLDVEFWGLPVEGQIVSDSLLITLNANGNLLSFYNINSGVLISENLRRGRGPGELLSTSQMQICGDSMWVFDIFQTGLFCFGITDLLENKDYKVLHEIRSDAFTNDMICIDRDMNVLAYTSDAPFSRFSVYDCQGSLKKSYGSLPFFEESSAELTMQNVEAKFALASDGKIIAAYKRADILEIYSPDFELLRRVQGPDGFLSDGEVEKLDASRFRIKPAENSRDAYFRPCVTRDEIWVIYSGRKFDKNSKLPSHFKEDIFVFDHDLNPLRAYKTNIPFYSISVDPAKRCIYSLTEYNGESRLVKFSF